LFYACDPNNTLDQLALDILYNLEQRCVFLSGTKDVEISPSIEVNLGIFKAKLEAKAGSRTRSPATIATQLVGGLESALSVLQNLSLCSGINIMLDELDQLSAEINFGHFMKIVHETLNNRGLREVTFILAGQQGVYTRLIREDPSFERLVRHVPLSTLDGDASDYVLRYASSQASPPFHIEGRANALILSLSSGYPYVLHLLGDAAFLQMAEPSRMTRADVAKGVEAVLKSDKREKYLGRFEEFTDDERKVIVALSEYPANSLPVEVPYSWLESKVSDYLSAPDMLDSTVDSLVESGHLVWRRERSSCLFAEELFRVFVTMARLEEKEIALNRAEKVERMERKRKEDERLRRIISSGNFEDLDLAGDLYELAVASDAFDQAGDIHQLDEKTRSQLLASISASLLKAKYTTAWEDEDSIFDVYDDYST
jgi:hypothetical protein